MKTQPIPVFRSASYWKDINLYRFDTLTRALIGRHQDNCTKVPIVKDKTE